MKSRTYRVWPEIKAVNCRHTQIALAECDDPEALEGLRKGFPQCFADDPTGIKVPLSFVFVRAMQRARKDHTRDQKDDEFWIVSVAHYIWTGACRDLGIPIIARRDGVVVEVGDPLKVEALSEKLVEQGPPDPGKRLTFDGEECILVEIYLDKEFNFPKVDEMIFALAPASCFEFDMELATLQELKKRLKKLLKRRRT